MAIATADDLRGWLNVPGQIDSADTPHLDLALAAAVEAVQEYTGRSWTSAVSGTRIYDGYCQRLYVDDLTTATLVEESSDRSTWTTRTASTYWLEPANSTPKNQIVSDTAFARFVRVTSTFDDSTVPSAVKLATLMVAARLWSRRRSASGVEGFGEFGVVRITRASDPDVAALLDPHRRMDKVAGIA